MPTKAQTLDINGMHCASCALLIKKSVSKVPGVTEANVNYANEKAHVVFDPTQASVDQLIAAVHSAGYQAALPAEGFAAVGLHEKRSIEISYWPSQISLRSSAEFTLNAIYVYLWYPRCPPNFLFVDYPRPFLCRF